MVNLNGKAALWGHVLRGTLKKYRNFQNYATLMDEKWFLWGFVFLFSLSVLNLGVKDISVKDFQPNMSQKFSADQFYLLNVFYHMHSKFFVIWYVLPFWPLCDMCMWWWWVWWEWIPKLAKLIKGPRHSHQTESRIRLPTGK